MNGLHNVQHVMNMDFARTVKMMLNCVNGVAAAVNVALIAITVANHDGLELGIEEIS